MNDRIRELLVESGFCFWADEEWGPGPGKVSWDCDYEKEMERFVELLVRECARVCRSQPNIYAHKGDRDNCAIAIEAHFGIEDKAEEFENWCKESDDGAAE